MKVGDRVICIKDSGFLYSHPSAPRKNEIYTVKNVGRADIEVHPKFTPVPIIDIGIRTGGLIEWVKMERFRKIEPLDTKAIADEFVEVIESPDKVRELETA